MNQRFIHFVTYLSGGAALTCIRMHHEMLEKGIDSQIIFLIGDNNGVKNSTPYYQLIKSPILRLWLKIKFKLKYIQYLKDKKKVDSKVEIFTHIQFPLKVSKLKIIQPTDILIFHWLANFIDFSDLQKIKANVFLLSQDINYFTGGCHYSLGCENNYTGCFDCPQIESSKQPKVIRTLSLKSEVHNSKKINYIFNTKWIKSVYDKQYNGNAQKAGIFRNGLPLNLYKPLDRSALKEKWGIGKDEKVIMAIADNINTYRKGMHLVKGILESVKTEKLRIVMVGTDPLQLWENQLNLGFIKDPTKLIEVYNLADFTIVPSLEDNQPNVITESLCCGTPVLAFNLNGMAELITNGLNGIFLNENDLIESARIIDNSLDSKELNELRVNARKFAVENLDITKNVSDLVNFCKN